MSPQHHHHPGRVVSTAVTMVLLLSTTLPLLVNARAIKEVTSIELTQNVITEYDDQINQEPLANDYNNHNNDDYPDQALEDTSYDEDHSAPGPSPSFFSPSQPSSNELDADEDFHNAPNNNILTFPTEELEQSEEEEEESDQTPSSTPSTGFNAFQIYNSKHNLSITTWDCKVNGESTTLSKACVEMKDIMVENFFQPAQPRFNDMVGFVKGDSSKLTVVIAGSTRESDLNEINAKILKRAEIEEEEEGEDADYESAPKKIQLIKNATLVMLYTLNLDDKDVPTAGVDEGLLLGHEGEHHEEEHEEEEQEEGGTLRPEDEEDHEEVEDTEGHEEEGCGFVKHVEEEEGHQEEDEQETFLKREVDGDDVDDWDAETEGGNMRPDDEDNLGEQEGDEHEDNHSEEEGEEERDAEQLPSWTAQEIQEIKEWCTLCVDNSRYYTDLSYCAKLWGIRSLDVAICDEPLPEEGDIRFRIIE